MGHFLAVCLFFVFFLQPLDLFHSWAIVFIVWSFWVSLIHALCIQRYLLFFTFCTLIVLILVFWLFFIVSLFIFTTKGKDVGWAIASNHRNFRFCQYVSWNFRSGLVVFCSGWWVSFDFLYFGRGWMLSSYVIFIYIASV